MSIPLWAWAALVAAIAGMAALDLVAVGRGGRAMGLREAVAWSVVWIAVGLAFALVLWPWLGGEAAGEYLSGYLVERSLSIDNVFVFALLFGYFAVPRVLQGRALLWGILLALVLRAGVIAAGAAVLDRLSLAVYAFGAFLVLTGVNLARHRSTGMRPERSRLLRLIGRLVPTTEGYEGSRLLARRAGRWRATPLLVALLAIAAADVMFAVDSIPAIFAVTREAFLVFAANAFALLGMRALYFLLADAMSRFVYLQAGLAAILVLVGAKMLLARVWHPPVWLPLLAIAAILGAAIVTSLRATRSHGDGRAGRAVAS
jgi:tellurite resistance protein TerC